MEKGSSSAKGSQSAKGSSNAEKSLLPVITNVVSQATGEKSKEKEKTKESAQKSTGIHSLIILEQFIKEAIKISKLLIRN